MPEITFTKKEILDLIKGIDIKANSASDNELKRKWFEFGAYDALRTLSEMVKDAKHE